MLITSGSSRVKTKQYTYKKRKEASHLEQPGRLVQRADNAIQQIKLITFQGMSVTKMYCPIYITEIYPADKVIEYYQLSK